MPRVPLKLFYGLNTSVPEGGLKEGNPVFTNATIDNAGNLGRRPGMQTSALTFPVSSSGIKNIYYWEYAEKVVAIDQFDVVVTPSATHGTATNLKRAGLPGNKVVFVEGYVSGGTNALFFVGDGGTDIYYITCATKGGTPGSVTACTGTTPPACTSLTWLADRLVANDEGSTSVYYSDVGDGATFSGDLFSAEADADFARFVARRGQELLIFGERTIEVYYNSGAPFERYQGGEIFSDCSISPHSITPYKGTFLYMDTKGRVNIIEGRQAKVISGAIDYTLYGLESSNVMGNIVEMGGQVFYTVSFQYGQKTFAFDLERGYWSKWMFNAGNNTNSDIAIISTTRNLSDATPEVYIALQQLGFKEMQLNNFVESNGGVNVYVESPMIDHGSYSQKRSNRLMGRMSNSNAITLQYKDEEESSFGNDRTITTSTNNVISETCLGGYRGRRYAITANSASRLALGDIYEDVEELGH